MRHLWTSLLIGLLVCNLAAPPATAQTGPPGSSPTYPPPPGAAPAARSFVDEFKEANTSHDGRLTLQQAEAAAPNIPHMALVVRRFAAVDVQHKGYITLQDIRAYRHQQRAASGGGAEPKLGD